MNKGLTSDLNVGAAVTITLRNLKHYSFLSQINKICRNRYYVHDRGRQTREQYNVYKYQ